MVIFRIADSSAELDLGIELRPTAIQQLREYELYGGGRRRTARDVKIHLYHFVNGHSVLQQLGHALGGGAGVRVDAFHIDSLEEFLHWDGIAHGRDITGDGAVAQRHQKPRMPADVLDFLEVVLAADSALL